MNIPGLTILTLDSPELKDFASARNELLKTAKTPWVLFLDSDESVSSALKQEITQVIKNPQYPAYYIARIDRFLGIELRHGETGKAKFIRLARQDFGSWTRPVHEKWEGKGKVGILLNPLLHNPHPDLKSFAIKIDHYSTIDAEYRYYQKQASSLFRILFFPLGKFASNYFVKLGFLDGVPGLIHALMMSWHSYLTWTKLYLLWHKN